MKESIAVIGAGQMGGGIAQILALSGFNVLLVDIQEASLERGRASIAEALERQVSRSRLTEAEKKKALQRITTSTSYDGFKECHFIIEAATENEEIKKTIFKNLTPYLNPETILATNTSSISITRLAAVTDRPHKFIGMHFMNPVPVMKLVELIRGIATDDATFDYTKDLVLRIGKTFAVSEDYPGFIVNRVLMPLINEAIYTLYESVGTIEAIDMAMKLGTNHPMGPFELADLIGLDTCLSIMNVLHDGLDGSKYRPCPLLIKYVEAGWLGRKTNIGFYDYRGSTPVPTR